MSSLNITHVHRNLHTRVTFLYLEFEDAFVILGLAAFTNVFGRFLHREVAGIPLNVFLQYIVPILAIPLLIAFKYLVDEVSDGAGSRVRRQTLLLQVIGDGQMITDNGRTYHVRPFAVQPGQAQIRNGRLELPNTQQRPGVPVLKGY